MNRLGALLVALCATLLLLQQCAADMYMHNPRGSNNRLDETSANRNNGNRLFDSQNNNRGGYNVGEKGSQGGENAQLASITDTYSFVADPSTQQFQYQMAYYEGSKLMLEWTNQHGCGGNEASDPHLVNCQIIIQYTCDTDSTAYPDKAMQVTLVDGENTNAPQDIGDGDGGNLDNIKTSNDNARNGRQESEHYYFECRTRLRNPNLFLADQNLNGNTARFTRQNPNGNRSGYECPEERDYYPYWHPTPWRDVAVLTDDTSRCSFYKANSNNNLAYGKCYSPTYDPNVVKRRTQDSCNGEAANSWKTYKHNLQAPDCLQAPWSRDNHLGNGRNGVPLSYNWTLPTIDELTASGVKMYTALGTQFAKCVLRMRYNISTDDYDPWNTNSTSNEDKNAGVRSPVTNNPTVDVGANNQGLRLAINTNQFGRTFQDRSHVFYIRKRPASFAGKDILNINVRGKRGNIVQVYPAVEYDFIPNRVHVKTDTLIHFQWTGSNSHNNGNPGGDGQTGDAGEGTGGTDRHNIVQLLNPGDNFPLPYDKFTDNMMTKATCYDWDAGSLSTLACQLILASSGYYRSTTTDAQGELDPLLNNAPASLYQGVVVQFNKDGAAGSVFNYACTRNNNFTNRSQKAVIIVDSS